MHRILSVILIPCLFGCVLIPKKKTSDYITSSSSCTEIISMARESRIEMRLNYLLPLYKKNCYQEVIALGSEIRQSNRDKYISISQELAEAVAYEGYSKEYVLEAYERIFLSILISISYQNLNQFPEAQIELNKAYDESVAKIYNSGEDEINTFLQALLWNRLSGYEKAAPFFRKIDETKEWHTHLKKFAKKIATEITRQKRSKTIDIYTLNQMPKVHFDWFENYSEIFSPRLSVKDCISSDGIILTTADWVKQIESRDKDGKDPLLIYKRAARLPVASLLSALVIGIGVSVSANAGGHSGEALAVTAILAYETFIGAMAPDMRYWYELPQAFYFGTDETLKTDPCLRRYRDNNNSITKFISL